MRIVYRAENIVDAYLVKGALEGHDLAAFVTGEYLTGAMGQLPASDLVAVMVPESQHAEATRIVAALLLDRQDDVETQPVPDPDGCVRPA